jgi:hypothetical protein
MPCQVPQRPPLKAGQFLGLAPSQWLAASADFCSWPLQTTIPITADMARVQLQPPDTLSADGWQVGGVANKDIGL